MKTFTYKEKFSVWYFAPAVTFIFFTIVCYIKQYGIEYRNSKLLLYPNSFYVLSAISVLFILSGIIKLVKSNESKQNPHNLDITDNEISIPKGKNSKIIIKISDITGLKYKHNKDEGKQLVVKTNGKNHEIYEARFNSRLEFEEFCELLEKK